jgi:secreted trypsin-like serine protease
VTSQWKILGIVSNGFIIDGHCDDEKYSIFTNVASFLDWIGENGLK